MTKKAYHEGVVLVRCPGCRNLHLVADRLGYFEDESVDIEKILEAKGERVRRGSMGTELKLQTPSAQEKSSSGASLKATPVLDPNVIELTEDDLAVLRTTTKSVNLKTGEAVDEGYVSVHSQKEGGGGGAT